MDPVGLKREGFERFVSVAALRGGQKESIPDKPGVYVVVVPETWSLVFLERSPAGWYKGRDPTVGMQYLQQKWVPGAQVLYIGKTKRTLKKRIREFLDFGEGKAEAHWGGRLVWQFRDSDSLLLAWLPVGSESTRDREKELLQQFKHQHEERLPFANLQN